MYSWVRRNSTILRGVLAILTGALVGETVSPLLLQYRAQVVLPWESGPGDPSGVIGFKEVESILFSVASLDQYAQSNDLLRSAMVSDLRSQFTRGLQRPLQIERAFSVERTDARNLPEAASKEMFKQITSELHIIATDSDETYARQLADLGRDYTIKTLLRSKLFFLIQNLLSVSKSARATSQAGLASFQFQLDSIERQIAAMEALRAKFKEATLSAGEAVSPAGEIVNLTTSNETINQTVNLTPNDKVTRFLSPVRQLIGAESARVDLTEAVRQTRLRVVRAEIGERFAVKILPLFASNDDGAKLFEKTFNELGNIERGSHTEDETLALREVRTQIEESLVNRLQIRFIDYKPYQPEASVSRLGIPRSLSIMVGIALGLALWWASANTGYLRRLIVKAVVPEK